MQVSQLLFDFLEDQGDEDFKTFKWNLMNGSDSWEAIPKSRLEKAPRTETVSQMIQRYGEESAVNITAKILRTMGNKNDAVKLEKAYTGAGAATSSTSSSASRPPAAPTTMSAQQGSVVFAPVFDGSTVGAVTVNINTPNQGN
ncbi:pyrin-like [Scomber scombrus]|uniref:Pyrin-like n=1 Tax=Scomber scombrus TaxID=13677 RepID=A0AAV1PM09_SCOSC